MEGRDADNIRELSVVNRNDVSVYINDVVQCKKYEGLLGRVTKVIGDSSIEQNIITDSSDNEMDGDSGDGIEQNIITDADDNEMDEDSGDGSDDNVQVEIDWINGSKTTEYTSNIIVVDRRFSHGNVVASDISTQQLGLAMDVNISVDLLSMDGKVIENVCSKDLKPIKEFNVDDFIVLDSIFGIVEKTSDIVTVLLDDGSVCEVIDVNPLELRPVLKYNVNCPYYPGQRVRSVLTTVFKSIRWISGSRKANRLQGTVIKVHPASVDISWIYPLNLNEKTKMPSSFGHNPKNITMLSFFTRTKWKLADFCQLPSCQQLPSGAEGTSTSKETNDTKSTDVSENCLGSSASSPKGSQESSSYNKTLQKILSKREMKALKKALKRKDNFEKSFFILNTYTTVDVIWQNGTKEYGLKSTSLIPVPQNDDQFFPERYVIEKALGAEYDSVKFNRVGVVVNVNSEERIVCVRWREELKQFDREAVVVSAYDLDLHPEYKYRYGDFAVRLPTPPIDDEEEQVQNDEACKNFTSLSNFGNIVDFQDGDVVVAWTDGVISKVGPHEINVIFLKYQNGDETGTETSDSNGKETNSANHGESTTTTHEVNTGELQKDNIKGYKFKHFDIIENASDHHYYSDTCNSGREWASRVQQEWKILERNLPDDIYVRAFEERMDLIKAAIIGADGTPYQNGIFFFDFHLPPNYPEVPPSVYYYSSGLRINPNLYEDGKICLSLLNTWIGEGNEKWVPSSSNILQVLVSLQGLVFTSKPYFNEAGYANQIGTLEGEQNAILYNENVYVLNLKLMLYLLRRSPMHFENFVKDHFRRRGHYILKACEDCLIEKMPEHSYSTGFKLSLTNLLPQLKSAFREVGVDCSEFEHQEI